MTTDNKTLADVQPGGMVRLGDQVLSTSEGARRYVADFFATQLRRHDFGDYILTELAGDFACALAQRLSAQPSPGGQGALVTDAMVYAAEAAYANSKPDNLHESFRVAIAAALAARQPVAAAVKDCLTVGGRHAVDQHPAIPEGWALVDLAEYTVLPQIPNTAMMDAGWPIGEQINDRFDVKGAYADLIAEHEAKGEGIIHGPIQQAAQAVDLAPDSIPNTPEVRDILGRPNFWCSPWANVLRMRGDEIPNKAEEEQAAVIRFMLNHYLANGTAWAETAGAELDAIRKVDGKAVGNG